MNLWRGIRVSNRLFAALPLNTPRSLHSRTNRREMKNQNESTSKPSL